MENSKKVLIVDDEPGIRSLLTEHYQLEGRQVLTAANGLEALKIIKEHGDFDLLITDMVMPNMDGAGFVEAYRKNGGTGQVYCITGSCEQEKVDQVYKAGIQGIIPKPFSLSHLP